MTVTGARSSKGGLLPRMNAGAVWSVGNGLGLDLGAGLVETILGIGEEDQPEYWPAVLTRRQGGVGSQRVGDRP